MGRKFSASRWSIVLTAVGVIFFLSLGQWQLERAAYKEEIQQKFESRLNQDYQVLPVGAFLNDEVVDDILFRKLIFQGRYDTAHSFLLDNQVHGGKAGYHVLTPLQLNDSDSIILVNRGWVEIGVSRQRLPEIPPPPGSGRVAGILSVPEASVFRMGEVVLGDNWPEVIPYIDLEALRQQYSDRLLPVVLWLAPEQEGNFIRVWKPVWMKPEKSRAYATQWFAFALIAGVLFIILNLRKVE